MFKEILKFYSLPNSAACTGLNIEYTQKGKAYIHTKIILQVRKIKVGETTFENRWTINE